MRSASATERATVVAPVSSIKRTARPLMAPSARKWPPLPAGSTMRVPPPVPRAAPHVKGLAALRSRVLTVIDTHRAIGLTPPGDAGGEAVIVELDGHHYALTVDSVDDVVEATGDANATRMPLEPNWARIAGGTVEAGGDMLLLVDVAALIAGPQAAAA